MPYPNWQPQMGPSAWQMQPQYQQPQSYSGNGPHIYNQQPQPANNLLRVTGPESAKAYSVPPNSSVVLFDADNPTFYLVTSDDSGFKSMRTFDFSERQQIEVQPAVEQADLSAFATKDDLEEIKSELSEMTKMLKGLM